MKKLALILTLALLAGCGREGKVRQAHIDEATKLCEANGGISFIENAGKGDEFEDCGWKCNRRTGKTLYAAELECRNGAHFDLKVSK